MKAFYRDKVQDLEATLLSARGQLTLVTPKATFSGNSIDDLSPTDGTLSAGIELFNLRDGSLADCQILVECPLKLVQNGEDIDALLYITVTLRGVSDNWSDRLQLSLSWGDQTVHSAGTDGLMETELLDLLKHLPTDIKLKSCFTCAYSDYSPAGQSMTGGLSCYRDQRETYLSVRNKIEYLQIYRMATEYVQEIDLCPEHQPRRPGTGYRG